MKEHLFIHTPKTNENQFDITIGINCAGCGLSKNDPIHLNPWTYNKQNWKFRNEEKEMTKGIGKYEAGFQGTRQPSNESPNLVFMRQKPQSEWTPEEVNLVSVAQERWLQINGDKNVVPDLVINFRNRILDEVIQICKEHLEDIKVSYEAGVFDSTSAESASQENKLIIDAVEKLKVCQ